MHVLDWNYVLQQSAPIRLLEICQSFSLINRDLYQLSSHEFVIASNRRKGSTGDELFGSIFYWASSLGAAQRISQSAVSGDDGALICPPNSLLLDGWRWKYGDILIACENQKTERYLASQIIVVGNPIGTTIAVGNLSYYFRSENLGNNDDKAFAVGVDLRGIRWQPCA